MKTNQPNRALVLTDGKAGHENQSRAFARALGCEPTFLPIAFKSRFHKALSYLFDWLGIRSLFLFKDSGFRALGRTEGCALVLGTGSGTFYAAKACARLLGVPCGVVLYPRGYRLATFDCILAPSFDRPAKAPNVIEIPANLVAADSAFYDQGVAAFRKHYAKTTGRVLAESPAAVSVIVGGPNKCSTMTAAWMKRELDALFASMPSSGPGAVSFWVTTSRRTPPEVERIVSSYPWDYKLLYSQDHFNPIPAFVTLSKRLYVTAESTGMLSEACTSGRAAVHVLDNLKAGGHKFRRFVDGLRKSGYVGGARKIDLTAQIARARGLLKMEACE